MPEVITRGDGEWKYIVSEGMTDKAQQQVAQHRERQHGKKLGKAYNISERHIKIVSQLSYT